MTTREVYEYGGGWGDKIHFWPEDQRKSVTGWKYRTPQTGDILRIPMKSGKVAMCRFTEIQPYRDPPDMFHANIEELCLEGQDIEAAIAELDKPTTWLAYVRYAIKEFWEGLRGR